jgi:hypothetical protein
MRHTVTRALALVTLVGVLCATVTAAPKYKGLTSGEWTAVWWQEIFAIPVEGGRHPLIDGGAFGGDNRTVFVGAPVVPTGSPKATLPVTIPAGTNLVLPIITVECSVAEEPPFHGNNEAELRACANGLLDLVTDPYAEINGKPLSDPQATRVESPLFRYGPLPANNVLGLAAGTQSDAVGAGYVLVLPPLSVGEHRIVTRANVPDVGIAVDAEVIVNVTREK